MISRYVQVQKGPSMSRTMGHKRKEHATLQERHMRGIYTKPTLTKWLYLIGRIYVFSLSV